MYEEKNSMEVEKVNKYKKNKSNTQDLDDISSTPSGITFDTRGSVGTDSTTSSDPSKNDHYKYDRVETLKLLNSSGCNQSTPTFHLGNDDIAVEDDETGEKALSNIESAKEMIRKLSCNTTTPNLKSSKSHYEFASTAYGVRMLNKDISNARVNLNVENLILVTKLNDISLVFLTRELVEWLLRNYPKMTVYVEDVFKTSEQFAAAELCVDSRCKQSRIKYWNDEFIRNNDTFFDLCITLGGDGTVLFVSSLFQKHVPPTISFSLGSLGFLTNFNFEDFKSDLSVVLKDKVKTNLRMRLQCKIYRRHEPEIDPETGKKICFIEFVSEHQILNEVTIDRGSSPFLSMLELYGNGSLLTVAQADGLIVATPTGSTAYSLSAGGSLVYPTVNAISVTPICPHTLSFRPIILPESMTLKIKVSMKARGGACVAFDGKSRVELGRGDFITIESSPYIFPTVEACPTEFIDSISRSLNWNVREEQKSFTHMLSTKNREKFATELCNISDSSEDEYIIEKKLSSTLGNIKLINSDSESSASIDNEIDTPGEIRVIRKKYVAGSSNLGN